MKQKKLQRNKYNRVTMLLNLLLLVTGFTALVLGANFLVSGASSYARRFRVSEPGTKGAAAVT